MNESKLCSLVGLMLVEQMRAGVATAPLHTFSMRPDNDLSDDEVSIRSTCVDWEPGSDDETSHDSDDVDAYIFPSFRQQIIFQLQDEFKIIKLLSNKVHRIVYLVERRTDQKLLIVYVVRDNWTRVRDKNTKPREIRILERLQSVPHVAQLVECRPLSSNTFIMIQTYQPGMRLDRAHYCNPYMIQQMMRQLLTAMQALEERKIVHRDIAVQNIVWDPLHMHLTLIDFDTAVKRRKRFYSHVGRTNYDPPEKMQCQTLRDELRERGETEVPQRHLKHFYDWHCDMYAAGIVFFMLLKNLNHSPSPTDVRRYVKAGLKRRRHYKYPELDLLFRMLAFEPGKRPSASEALEHPYFAQPMEEAKADSERVLERMRHWQQQDRASVIQALNESMADEEEGEEEEDDVEEKEKENENEEEEEEDDEETDEETGTEEEEVDQKVQD